MKTLRTGAALAAVAALTLTACGGGSGSSDATATDATTAAAGGLSGTLQGIGASSMRAARVWRAGFKTAYQEVTVN